MNWILALSVCPFVAILLAYFFMDILDCEMWEGNEKEEAPMREHRGNFNTQS